MSATERLEDDGLGTTLGPRPTESPESSVQRSSTAKVDGDSYLQPRDISSEAKALLSQDMANKSTNDTFSVNTTQLMDIGDSILHEISGVSGLHDTLASQSDPGCPTHKCCSQQSRSGTLETSGLSLSLDHLPRVLSSSRNSQVTMLEDIGDSILNYSNGTNTEEDVQRLNSMHAQNQEQVETKVCASSGIQDKSLNPIVQDLSVPESDQSDSEFVVNECDEEVELISQTEAHAPKCGEISTDKQNLMEDCQNTVRLNKHEEKPRGNEIYDSFDKLVDECKSDLLRQYKCTAGVAIHSPEVLCIPGNSLSIQSLNNIEITAAFSDQRREKSFDTDHEEAVGLITPMHLRSSLCEPECTEPARTALHSSVYPKILPHRSSEVHVQINKSAQSQDNPSTFFHLRQPPDNRQEDEASDSRQNDQNHNLIICGNVFQDCASERTNIDRDDSDDISEQTSGTSDHASSASEEKEEISVTSDESKYIDGGCKEICIHDEFLSGKNEESGQNCDPSEIYSRESEQISTSSKENRETRVCSDGSKQTTALSNVINEGKELVSVSHDEGNSSEQISLLTVTAKVYSEKNEQTSVSSETNEQVFAVDAARDKYDEIGNESKKKVQILNDYNENNQINETYIRDEQLIHNSEIKKHIPGDKNETVTLIGNYANTDCEDEEPNKGSSDARQYWEQPTAAGQESGHIGDSCQKSDHTSISNQSEQMTTSINLVREHTAFDKDEYRHTFGVDSTSRSCMELDQTVVITHSPHSLDIDDHECQRTGSTRSETKRFIGLCDEREASVMSTVKSNAVDIFEVDSKSDGILGNEADHLDIIGDTNSFTSRTNECEDAENIFENKSLSSTVKIGFTYPPATRELHSVRESVNELPSSSTAKVSGDDKESVMSQGTLPETPVTELTRDLSTAMQSTPDSEETMFFDVEYSTKQAKLHFDKENGLDLKSYDTSPPREENVHQGSSHDIYAVSFLM